jgi:Ankyrin repeats (3 copies)/MYND finger
MIHTNHKMIMAGIAPDLTGTETPFEFGYATLVIAGSQRLVQAIAPYNPVESLKYLVSQGAPVDSEDIVGLTALHHAAMRTSTPTELIRALLECGANPNHQNRYGEVPILGAYQANQIAAINLLLEHGADLDIEEADHFSPLTLYLSSGPQVTAAVRRWIRKRNGEDALMEEKVCNKCRRSGSEVKLSVCGKCRATRYCSTECQRVYPLSFVVMSTEANRS